MATNWMADLRVGKVLGRHCGTWCAKRRAAGVARRLAERVAVLEVARRMEVETVIAAECPGPLVAARQGVANPVAGWLDGRRAGIAARRLAARVASVAMGASYVACLADGSPIVDRAVRHHEAELVRLDAAKRETQVASHWAALSAEQARVAVAPVRKARNPHAKLQRDSKRAKGRDGRFLSDRIDFWATCFPRCEAWIITTVVANFGQRRDADETVCEMLGNCLIVADRLAKRKSHMDAAEQARFDDCPALVYKRAIQLWLRERRGEYDVAGHDVVTAGAVPVHANMEARQASVDTADSPEMRLMPLASAMLGKLGETLQTAHTVEDAARLAGVTPVAARRAIQSVRLTMIRALAAAKAA